MKKIQCSYASTAKRLIGIEYGRDIYKIIHNSKVFWTVYLDDNISKKETIEIIKNKYIEGKYFSEIEDKAEMFCDGDFSMSEYVEIQDDIKLCHGFNFVIEDIPAKCDPFADIKKRPYIDDSIFSETLYKDNSSEVRRLTPYQIIIEKLKKKPLVSI